MKTLFVASVVLGTSIAAAAPPSTNVADAELAKLRGKWEVISVLGLENANPVQYRIHLIPDQYPQGEIISPIEDLEVAGSEILPLLYSASDDYGLTAIRLIYQMAGTERSITLKGFKDNHSVGLERFKWDLGSLTLTPGDRVTYRLEVWDNDSVSGPKAGYSRTLSLMRSEYLYPSLADRSSPQEWEEQGSPDIRLRAGQRVSEILRDHYPEYIDPTVDRQIRERFPIRLPRNVMRPDPSRW